MLDANTIIGRMARLAAGRPSYAAVGNGPFSSNLFAVIDSAFVVRCNGFTLGFPAVGNRVDLNVLSLYHEVVPDQRVAWQVLGAFPATRPPFEHYTTLRDMDVDWLGSRERPTAFGNDVWKYSEEDPLAAMFAETCIGHGALTTVAYMGVLRPPGASRATLVSTPRCLIFIDTFRLKTRWPFLPTITAPTVRR